MPVVEERVDLVQRDPKAVLIDLQPVHEPAADSQNALLQSYPDPEVAWKRKRRTK